MEVEPFNGSTRCHLGLSHFLAFIRKLSHFPEAQHLLWFLACFGWNTTVFCQSGTLITFEGGSSFTKGRCWCDASEVSGLPSATAEFNFVEHVLAVSPSPWRGLEKAATIFSNKMESTAANGTQNKKGCDARPLRFEEIIWL